MELILAEFLLYNQQDRQIFPTYRFDEILGMMTQLQKDRIFKYIQFRLKGDKPIFQLRMMFEHEINGQDADDDNPTSLDHKVFDQDFFNPPKPVSKIRQ